MIIERGLGCFVRAGKLDAGTSHVFSSGLQDLLAAMAGVYCAGIAEGMNVPPGLTGRFARAFERPTLGGLREFVLWLSTQESGAPLTELSAYLTARERKPSGWISTLVQLRNLWAHPKEESPAQIETKAEALLADMPDFAALGRIEIDESGPRWAAAGGSHALGPFLWAEDERLRVFTGFAPPDRLLFGDSDAPTQPRFRDLWRELRLLDPLLEGPTPDEFHARARRRANKYDAGQPWWMAKALAPGPAGILVAPGLLDGALAHAADARPGATSIEIGLPEKESPLASVAAGLGLAGAPSMSEFLGFASAERPVILGVRARGADSRRFLELLYWLADVRASGGAGHVRVLVERGPEELERDREALWDRLPDDLPGLLRPPPRTSPADLPGFLWTAERRRFLGLF